MPDFSRSNKKRSNLKLPKEHERRVSEAINGKRQPGSGAFNEAKGDVSSDTYLVECKRTVNQSLSIKAEWLVKITREAFAEHKIPAFSFEFDRSTISSVELRTKFSKNDRSPMGLRNLNMTEETWVAVPLSVFASLVEKEDE